MKTNKLIGIVLGALLIAGGVLTALSLFGLVETDFSLDGWWTLFIILPAIGGLFTDREKLGSLFMLSLGIYLLLAARDIIDYGVFWKLLVPTVIVLLGIKLIVHSLGTKSTEPSTVGQENADGNASQETTDKNDVECVSVFNSQTADCNDKDIRLAKVGAVFGGTKCNLSEATFRDGSQLDIFCLFGGAELVIPANIEVSVNAFCLFGGIDDKRKNSETPKTARLTVNGFCLFGGAEIKD